MPARLMDSEWKHNYASAFSFHSQCAEKLNALVVAALPEKGDLIMLG